MLRSVMIGAVAWATVLYATPAFAQPEGPQSEAPADAPAADPLAPVEMTEEELAAAVAEFEASLTHKTGKVSLPDAKITLTVPESFYFLGATDAQKVLTEAWGNPPDSKVTGMLFPAGASPFDQASWGVVLTFEETGYVSDEDASTIDYDMLIDAMRENAEAENAQRKAQGYETIEIIGWAATPRYDAGTHKLYWAKELSFDGDPEHTLNYDMRVLGRYGVLSLNFVATVDQLAEIEAASPAVLAIAEFDQGSRYTDFNAATDAKADFGVAGLIGGTAAAAVLAKNGGLIAALLGFLAKGWYLVVGAIAGIGALIRNMFGGKPKLRADPEQRAATAFFDDPPPADPAPPAGPPPPPPGV